MRVLVCGDRKWDDSTIVAAMLDGFGYGPEGLVVGFTVISGMARGADRFAADWGLANGCLLAFPADWQKYGKGAGPIRNQQMLDEGKPDLVIAFHDYIDESKGTRDMVLRAKEAGIPVYIVSRP